MLEAAASGGWLTRAKLYRMLKGDSHTEGAYLSLHSGPHAGVPAMSTKHQLPWVAPQLTYPSFDRWLSLQAELRAQCGYSA